MPLAESRQRRRRLAKLLPTLKMKLIESALYWSSAFTLMHIIMIIIFWLIVSPSAIDKVLAMFHLSLETSCWQCSISFHNNFFKYQLVGLSDNFEMAMLPGFDDADGGAKGDDHQRPETPTKGKVKVVEFDAPPGASHDPQHSVRQRWQQRRKRAT